MIKVDNIELTSVAASGALNFFGPGKGNGHNWWYHKYLKLIPNFDYSDLSSWIAKTTTVNPRAGNMEIDEQTLQPKKIFPDCVVIKFFEGVMLNAVGLSSPGLEKILKMNEWQKNSKPFGISIMALGGSPEERLREIREIAYFIKSRLPFFRTSIFIEVNDSCPNVGHDPCSREEKILERLKTISAILDIPISVKLNALVSLETIKAIEQSGFCSWISFANTIPFSKLPDQIDWKRFYGTADKKLSPLAIYGGGGFSGWPLVEIHCKRIREFREAGITIPILGGGGIGCRNMSWLKKEIQAYYDAGANALQFGSIFPLRPWLVKPAIKMTNEKFGRR